MSRVEQPFIWPPIPAPTPAAPEAPRREIAGAKPSRFVEILRAAERHWLLPTALPLSQRMADEGWAPDAFGAFCNRCGGSTGPHEETEFGCATCRDAKIPWDHFVRLGEFRDPLRQWVHEVKFTRWRRLGTDLGRLLGERLLAAGLSAGDAIVVPMPTTLLRRTARGIDHAEILARGVAGAVDGPVVRALKRRHRPSQRTLSPSERSRNVAGAFRRVGEDFSGGAPVILVDDVRTSGATLSAAARALKTRQRGSFPLWAGVLGVASEPDRRVSAGV